MNYWVIPALKQFPSRLTPQVIMSHVSEFFGIPVSSMVSKSRKREIVVARFVSIYFIKKKLGFTLVSIAKLFTLADHSSVIHALSSVENDSKTNDEFRSNILAISHILSGENPFKK